MWRQCMAPLHELLQEKKKANGLKNVIVHLRNQKKLLTLAEV